MIKAQLSKRDMEVILTLLAADRARISSTYTAASLSGRLQSAGLMELDREASHNASLTLYLKSRERDYDYS